MTVEIGGESFIVPLSFISEAFLAQPAQVKSIASGPRVVQVRESYVPMLDLEPLLQIRREAAHPRQQLRSLSKRTDAAPRWRSSACWASSRW